MSPVEVRPATAANDPSVPGGLVADAPQGFSQLTAESLDGLLKQHDAETAAQTYRYFIACGFSLSVLLFVFRIQPALAGEEHARLHLYNAALVFVLSLLSTVLVRRGHVRVASFVVIAATLGIVLFNFFEMQLGVRAASAPFMVFALLLSIMSFGMRAGVCMLVVCTFILGAALYAEAAGWLAGPLDVRYAPTTVNFVCLVLTYLFVLGFAWHTHQRAQALARLLKERQLALQQALAQTDDVQGSKTRFLASLSSELHMSLQELRTSIDALEAQRAPSTAVGGLARVSTRMMQMLETALGSARLRSPAVAEADICSPLAVVQMRCEYAMQRARQKGIDLIEDWDPQLAPLCALSADDWAHAVDVLLDNAVRYTLQGNVLVRLTCLEETGGLVTWRLVVADTGVGIPETLIRRMHHILNRPARPGSSAFADIAPSSGASSGSSRRVFNIPELSNSGMSSLLRVRRWMDTLGGDMEILSRVGEGTVTTLTFTCQRSV